MYIYIYIYIYHNKFAIDASEIFAGLRSMLLLQCS